MLSLLHDCCLSQPHTVPRVAHCCWQSYDWQMIGKCSKFQTRSLLVACMETPGPSPTTEPSVEPVPEVARFRSVRCSIVALGL